MTERHAAPLSLAGPPPPTQASAAPEEKKLILCSDFLISTL